MNYHPKIIEFFKKHNMYDEEMFKYLQEHSTMIDYNDEEQRPFIGCFYILDRLGRLQDISLFIPYVNGEETMLISIHEITHGIENYQKLGKKFIKDITIEALPLLYEKLYILENPTDKLIEYSKYLDNVINEECEKEYKFALKIREVLLSNYHYDMHKMAKLTKKLAKKYPQKRHWYKFISVFS